MDSLAFVLGAQVIIAVADSGFFTAGGVHLFLPASDNSNVIFVVIFILILFEYLFLMRLMAHNL